MKYAIIVWWTEYEFTTSSCDTHRGHIYGWYESLATAINTATNLVQWESAYKAVAVKMM